MRYIVYKSLPLNTVRKSDNTSPFSLHLTSSAFIWILSLHLCLHLPNIINFKLYNWNFASISSLSHVYHISSQCNYPWFDKPRNMYFHPAAPSLFSNTFNAYSSLTVKDHLSLSNFSFFVSLPQAITSLVANIIVSFSKTLGNNYGCSILYTSMILNFEIQFLAGEP